MLRFAAAIVLALLTPAFGALAEERAGDIYSIRIEQKSEFNGDRSSGGGTDNNAVQERVIGWHDGGIEIELDLPAGTSAQDRQRQWQLPVRILRRDDGSMKVLNVDELEARIDDWLKFGQMGRESCGTWIFTWNAFKIECDPQSVLYLAGTFDLRIAVSEGTQYQAQVGGELAVLHADPADAMLLVAETPVNADEVRRQLAEADRVSAQLHGKPAVKLEEALKAHAADKIEGTIVTRFRVDANGELVSRQQVVHMVLVEASGARMESTTTTTIERELLSRGDAV